MDLEEALRERYEQVSSNIARDRQQARAYAAETKLHTGAEKRIHERMKDREQVEWYKRDELAMLASMAGVDLDGSD